MRSRLHRTLLPAAVCSALVFGATACGSNEPEPIPTESTSVKPTPSATVSRTPTTPEGLAQAALESFLAISEKAQATGAAKDYAPASKVATGDIHIWMQGVVATYAENGLRLKGTVKHNLKVTKKPNAGSLIFTDCRDETGSRVIDKRGKEIATTDEQGKTINVPDRYEVAYTVALVPVKNQQKEWRVVGADYLLGKAC